MRIGSLTLLAIALLASSAAGSITRVNKNERPLHLRIERDGDHVIARLVTQASPPVRVRFVLEINGSSRTRHSGAVEARPVAQVISSVRFRAIGQWTASLIVEPVIGPKYIEDAGPESLI